MLPSWKLSSELRGGCWVDWNRRNCAFSAVFADPLIKIPRKYSERSFHAPQQHSGMIRYERDEVRTSWSLKFSDDESLKILHVVQVETFFREIFSTWANVWECEMFKLSMRNRERWLFETPQHIIRKLCRKKRNEKYKLYSKSREEFSYNNKKKCDEQQAWTFSVTFPCYPLL